MTIWYVIEVQKSNYTSSVTDTSLELLAGDGSDISLFTSYINCHSTLYGSDYKDVPMSYNIYNLHIVARCHYCDFRYVITGIDSQGNEISIEDKTVSNRTSGTGAWSTYEYDVNLFDRIGNKDIVSAIRHIKIEAFVDDKSSGYDNADIKVSGYAEGITWIAD